MSDRIRHRGLRCVFGTQAETAEQGLSLCQLFEEKTSLWLTTEDRGLPADITCLSPREIPLGTSWNCVVISGHDGLNPDILASASGLVRGGGLVVVRLDCQEGWPRRPTSEVTGSNRKSVPQSAFSRYFMAAYLKSSHALNTPRGQVKATLSTTSDQHEFIASALGLMRNKRRNRVIVLTGDRGRGKSTSMGMLCGKLLATGRNIVLTGPRDTAVTEIIRWATTEEHPGSLIFRAPDELKGLDKTHILVVDEAAQLPIHVLRDWTTSGPWRNIIFSTTTDGYEGTGRGFALRFVPWLEQQAIPFARFHLLTPIRWSLDDPVERFLNDVLCLGGAPKKLESSDNLEECRHLTLNGEQLTREPELLKQFFGLLVESHYRTVPSDLERLIDAPNMRAHLLIKGHTIVAASLIALEGELSPQLSRDVLLGQTRLKGHAVPETLISHLGFEDAGGLRWARSVRIATREDVRRKGYASKLIEHIHKSYEVDLFCTMFGGTAELLKFRRHNGYIAVRVSPKRGARSGEPTLVMVRAASKRGKHFEAKLNGRFVAWMKTGFLTRRWSTRPFCPKPLLIELGKEQGKEVPLESDVVWRDILRFTHGQGTLEECILGLEELEKGDFSGLPDIAEDTRTILSSLIQGLETWEGAAQTQKRTVRSTMKALKSELRMALEKQHPWTTQAWNRSANPRYSFDFPSYLTLWSDENGGRK